MDSTNENVFSFGRLEEVNTWWEMTPVQADHFRMAQMVTDAPPCSLKDATRLPTLYFALVI